MELCCSPTPTQPYCTRLSAVSFLKRFAIKGGSLPLFAFSLQGTSLQSEDVWEEAISPSRVHCALRRWWVGVLRWQENWIGTPRTYRPHAFSLIKPLFLFSLAICLLHVTMVVKFCVICCDSFIILESSDVSLLSLQIQQGMETFFFFFLNLLVLYSLLSSNCYWLHLQICWKGKVKMWNNPVLKTDAEYFAGRFALQSWKVILLKS